MDFKTASGVVSVMVGVYGRAAAAAASASSFTIRLLRIYIGWHTQL
jgi:hypothetical protein